MPLGRLYVAYVPHARDMSSINTSGGYINTLVFKCIYSFPIDLAPNEILQILLYSTEIKLYLQFSD